MKLIVAHISTFKKFIKAPENCTFPKNLKFPPTRAQTEQNYQGLK